MNNDPKDIFKKFSESSRKVLISSQKIAQNTRTAINSQHMLLALAVTPGTLAHSVLQEHMISLDQIRLVISLQSVKSKSEEEGLSVEGKRILEKAAFMAKKYHHSQIDPEHILLAIVSLEGSLGYEIISRVGSDPALIRDQIDELFTDIEALDSKGFNLPINQSQIPPSNGFDERPNMPDFPQMPDHAAIGPQKNILDYYTVDLTAQASQGKVDPLVGREKEIQRVIQILSRRTKNNPVLVGEPGVGKTAIVEGLAERIVNHQVPQTIADKKIIMLDLALLVAGTMYRGQFEDRIKKLMDELEKMDNVILFIDELHTMVGAGSAEGSLDAANILKPSLAKGKLRLIGATTLEEYRKVIEKDTALERRLQRVIVEEPSPLEAIEIIKGLRPKYEEFHGIKISDEAIKSAVSFSRRYINDRYLPDKAIDLIDEASAAHHLHVQDKEFFKVNSLQKELASVRKQKEAEVNNQNYQKAAELRTLEIRLVDEIDYHKKNAKSIQNPDVITEADIAKVVSLWTNVPVENLAKQEKLKFLHLEENLKKLVIGQDEAIAKVARAIRRQKTGIANPNRPIGSFIFLGPTGVGKTELARVLAQELFGSREAIIKIDMSEFIERHNVSRLVGAPPGYVGYEEAGKLTEQVRQHPFSIVLFDEIEKAHPEVFNILLQIFEDGELTDAKGKRVNFRNTIIILTSNIGVSMLTQQAAIGFQAKGSQKKKAFEEYERMKNDIILSLKSEFRPELINRIDNIVVFRPLDKSNLRNIIDLDLTTLKDRLETLGYRLEFDPKIKDIIIKHGYDSNFGARPLRRAISDLIEDPLSEKILSSRVQKGQLIKVKAKNDQIVFEIKKNSSKTPFDSPKIKS